MDGPSISLPPESRPLDPCPPPPGRRAPELAGAADPTGEVARSAEAGAGVWSRGVSLHDLPGVLYSFVHDPEHGPRQVVLAGRTEELFGARAAASLAARPGRLFDLIHPEDRAGIERARRRAPAPGATVRAEYRVLTDCGYRRVEEVARAEQGELGCVRRHGFLLALEQGRPAAGPRAPRAALEQPQLVADGRELSLCAGTVPLPDADGRIVGVLGCCADASDRRRELGVLGPRAEGIAHDFNNLLMSVLGNAGLVLMQLGPDSAARAPLHDIETAARRAAELCRQLLACSDATLVE